MSADPTVLSAVARAEQLALSVLGTTSPNPPVGAVVLDPSGRVLGEGATQPAGGPHAEVLALRAAGPAARDATLVVTLEPCAHTGRTPPCTDAILAAGVGRVWYRTPDPTDAAGGGAQRLRAAGVDVRQLTSAAQRAIGAPEESEVGEHPSTGAADRWWLRAVRLGRPTVIWKTGSSLDGRVAAADRTSRWITSTAARADAHLLRSRVDAVLVGSGTVLTDDPQLTVRDPAGALASRQPLRVVMDRRSRVPRSARVFDDAADTVVLAAADPADALRALWERGVRSVLLEGGPTLAGGFVAARCVEEVVAYLAPVLLGAGPSSLAGAGVTTLTQAVRLDVVSVRRLGPDLRVEAEVAEDQEHPAHAER